MRMKKWGMKERENEKCGDERMKEWKNERTKEWENKRNEIQSLFSGNMLLWNDFEFYVLRIANIAWR